MIEPNPDWYGSYARRSALADYLELLALSGRSVSVEDLADLIRDNQWIQILGERISDHSESEEEAEDTKLGEELDRALERATDVLAVIRERVFATADHYPFQLSQDGRLRFSGDRPANDPYVRLLAVTIAHALRLELTRPPYQVFEGIVEEALSSWGLSTVGVGARARIGGGFAKVLAASCASVGLDAYPGRASHKIYANDEGSDVLSNLWIGDRRPGGVQLVGQVTCARSNDWDQKIQEPAPDQWRNWLGGMRSPVIYLAVPHHVEDVMRSYLMEKRDRDVVDRLRLAPILAAPIVGESEIIDSVLGENVI
jgi:hypothetical protein